MEKLAHWDSGGKEEIRKVPIVCSVCNKQVSVGGWIHEGELVFENCPGCGAPIRAEMYAGVGDTEDQEAVPFPIYAEVTWKIEGGVESERTTKIGPLFQVTSLLTAVLNTGVEYFAHSTMSPGCLWESVCRILVTQVLTTDQMSGILDLYASRLAEDVVAQGPFTIVSSGGNGKIQKPQEKKPEDEDTDKKENGDDE